MDRKDFEKIDIRDLIPQQAPFIMVDKLLSIDRVNTITSFAVREDNIFYEDGKLDVCALVENIAQTCAVRMGYINLYVNKDNIKLGFIGSIKKLHIKRTAILGEQLTTTVSIIEEIMRITLVSATVKVGDEEIVTGEMKIAISDIDSIKGK